MTACFLANSERKRLRRGNEMNPRYKLEPPVQGGYEFWAITDSERDVELVTIHKDVPQAEYVANVLLALLSIPTSDLPPEK
jgi:hypothetical protein